MTATAHAIVGAAIATRFSNPVVALPLALASHFVCDKIPHWDLMTSKDKSRRRVLFESVIDVLIGFALVGIFFVYFRHSLNPALVFLGAFTAQLPDWLELPYFVFGKQYPIFYQNYRAQKWFHDVWFDSRLSAPWGVITQVITVALVFFWGNSH